MSAVSCYPLYLLPGPQALPPKWSGMTSFLYFGPAGADNGLAGEQSSILT